MLENETRIRVGLFQALQKTPGQTVYELEQAARKELGEKLDVLGPFDEFIHYRLMVGDFSKNGDKYYLTHDGASQMERWMEMLEEWDNRNAMLEDRSIVDGVKLIERERLRQVEGEGFDAQRDDEYFNGSLADAAACYAATKKIYSKFDMKYDGNIKEFRFTELWPWSPDWDKRQKRPYPLLVRHMMKDPAKDVDELINIDGRIKELAKAGALCAAEIDRLERLKKAQPEVKYGTTNS